MPATTDLRDALGTQHTPVQGDPRIVSLVPSLTELLCELGLAANLVGRSGFCIHPRETVTRIPKMGGTKDADIEKIRAAAPTHLVVNVDENRREQVDANSRGSCRMSSSPIPTRRKTTSTFSASSAASSAARRGRAARRRLPRRARGAAPRDAKPAA
jgi:hypothetical protein